MTFLQVVWDVNPAIFEIGSFQLRYYSLCFAVAFVVAYVLVKRMYKREGVPVKELDSLTIYVIVGGIVGARLGHCLFYEWSYYSRHVVEMLLPFGFTPNFHFTGYQGLASHGGAVGVVVAVLIFKRKALKHSFLWLMDRIVVPTGFVGALIRLGNLMNSEIYGLPTDMPWGFIFVRNNETQPCHPTQIYEMLCYTAVSILLMQLYKNQRLRDKRGFLLGMFLVTIFTARFLIEFIKLNQVAFEQNLCLNMGQILSILPVIIGLILIFVKQKNTTETKSC